MQKRARKEDLMEKIYFVLREEIVATFKKTEDCLEIRLVTGQEFVLEIKEKE